MRVDQHEKVKSDSLKALRDENVRRLKVTFEEPTRSGRLTAITGRVPFDLGVFLAFPTQSNNRA